MNRRDLFKTLAAVPVAAAVTPLVVADDGVALTSAAHPCAPVAPEDVPIACELSPGSFEILQLDLPAHEWDIYSNRCVHCGAAAQYVEDNLQALVCWGHKAAKRLPAVGDWLWIDPWV
jgi:hypothetical protein